MNRPFKLKTKANKSPKLTWAQKSQTKAGPTCVRSLRGRLRGPEGPITSPPGLLPPAWPVRRRRPLIGGPHLSGHCAPFFFPFSLLYSASASPFRHRVAPKRHNGHARSSPMSPRTTPAARTCGTTPRPKTLVPGPLDSRHVPLRAHHEPRRRSSMSVPKNPSAPAYKTPAP